MKNRELVKELDIMIGTTGIFLLLLGLSNFLKLSLNKIIWVWIILGIIMVIIRFFEVRKVR